jgi:hypothetical protein
MILRTVCSLFDSWFGYILWGLCFFQLYRRKPASERTLIDQVEVGLNVLMLIVGAFFLGAGTYASVQSIMNSYALGAISECRYGRVHRGYDNVETTVTLTETPFTCVNTGFTFTR